MTTVPEARYNGAMGRQDQSPRGRRRAGRRHAAWLLAGVVGLLPPGALAAVYRFIDEHGQVHLTDRPPHDGYRQIFRTWKGWVEPSYDPRQFRRNRARFAPLIAETARTYRLPDALLHAVITAESAYDPNALSSAGAVGLMQLMPATAARFGVTDRRNPRANVDAGTRYLKLLLAQFGNDLTLAVAAYNAGENAVLRHGRKVPPFPETERYVRKVLEHYRKYSDEGIPSG